MSLPRQRQQGSADSTPVVGPNISGLSGIQADLQAILFKNRPNLTKYRSHGNKSQPRNILYGSIESAIPENPLLGENISGISAIQAEL